GGIVITDFGSRARCYGMAVQGDGKIVVAGWAWNGSNRDFALARYTANGALDPNFGTNGKVTTPIGNSDELAFDVAVQNDGKIVAAGWSSNGSNRDFALVRYTAGGALDPSFGTGGMVTTPIGSRHDIGQSVVVESDGKIIVVGSSDNGSDFDIALVRYTANGALDPSFGTGGKVTTPIGSSADLGSSLALLRDGKIVVAGWSTVGANFDIALLRYADSGALGAVKLDGQGMGTFQDNSRADMRFYRAVYP